MIAEVSLLASGQTFILTDLTTISYQSLFLILSFHLTCWDRLVYPMVGRPQMDLQFCLTLSSNHWGSIS